MELVNRIAVLVITHDRAKIWTTQSAKGDEPLEVEIQIPTKHLHVREAQHHGGHATSQYDVPYFDHLAELLEPVSELLLIGHGEGKSNSASQFLHHIQTHRPELARKVIGELHENIPALTDQQLLEKARHWFSQRLGVPVHYWQVV